MLFCNKNQFYQVKQVFLNNKNNLDKMKTPLKLKD